MGASSMNCIILSSKSWNAVLLEKLKQALPEHDFHLISEKEDFTLTQLKKLNADKVFVPHWSQIIPADIFEAYECILFHMTDLPFGRGGSPLQNLIVRGFKETKISALRVVQEIDAGGIYLKQDLSLEGTAEEIFIRASKIVEKMIINIIQGDLQPISQDGEVVIFERRKPEDGKLNNLTDLNLIFDYIRMLDAPTYPKAYVELEHYRIEFTKAKLNDDESIEANVRIIKK